jgi:transposase-like protein
LTLTKRNRTSANDIGYGLYLYFPGLSYRNTAKALSRFKKEEVMSPFGNRCRNKNQKNILQQNKNISKFIVDETQIKVGKDYFWLLWVVAIKPKDKYILHIHICQQKETHVCCRTFSTFFSKEVRKISCFN